MILEYSKFLYKIMKNKLAMRGICKPSLFRLDLAVTYQCNAKCKYCKIWKIYYENPKLKFKELKKVDYKKLFDQLDLSWLHITGGEPFLRPDLPEIVRMGDEQMSLVLVDTSTNGLLPGRVVDYTKKILENIDCKFIVGVSLDGPKEIHNKSRGIGNAWDKAIDTYLQLRALKEEYHNLDTHINHVISPLNLPFFEEFLEALKELGIGMGQVSLEVVRKSEFFKNEKVNTNLDKAEIIEKLRKIIELYQTSRFTFRRYLRTIYIEEMINYLNREKSIPCTAGYSSIFIDPYGSIYPCSMMGRLMGTLQDGIESILYSEQMKKWRKKVMKCNRCWSGCEGITSLIQNFLI